MAEHVVAVNPGLRWDANCPVAVMTSTDDGLTRLSVRPHADDEDQRDLLLWWTSVRLARMEPPNDEAVAGHRLYAAGLQDVLWVGQVLESNLIEELKRRNANHPRHSEDLFHGLRHWILRLKECVVEVIAKSFAIARIDATDARIDETELWVEVRGKGRYLLHGNAHTAPGRISAWSVERGGYIGINKDQVSDASPAARTWIDGFVHASEPEFLEYMGIDYEDEFCDEAAWQRYEDFLSEFRQTGRAPMLDVRPTIPLPVGGTFQHQPWSLAGGQVWTWTGERWALADPQPALNGSWLLGTTCAERGHCDMAMCGERHSVCDDCGQTGECEEDHASVWAD